MSGASYNYAYRHAEDMAEAICEREYKTELRILFSRHLKKCAAAMHDIEWVDSMDYAKGYEDAAILAVLHDSANTPVVHTQLAVQTAKNLCLELLSLKGNSFEVNQLAEKIHYALS